EQLHDVGLRDLREAVHRHPQLPGRVAALRLARGGQAVEPVDELAPALRLADRADNRAPAPALALEHLELEVAILEPRVDLVNLLRRVDPAHGRSLGAARHSGV